MNTAVQERSEPAFHAYPEKAQASPNTICSCIAARRLYYSLYDDLIINHLVYSKSHLINHCEAATVNNRIYGIDRYLGCLGELRGGQTLHSRLAVIRAQQAAFLDSVISREGYGIFKKVLKDDGNLLWYFVVRFLVCTEARISKLMQIKAEHLHLGYIDLCAKGGKVRRLHFPDALCRGALERLAVRGQASGFLSVGRNGSQVTSHGISSQLKTLAIHCQIPPEAVYPHFFWYKLARNFLEGPNDISLLTDLIGHKSIKTARIYLAGSTQK